MSDDMERMKADISEIKAAVLSIQADAKSHRDDTRSLQDMMRRTMVSVAQLTGHMFEMKQNVATKDDVGRLTGQIEGLAAKVDQRLDWAKHEVRLDDHAKRLARLEEGRA